MRFVFLGDSITDCYRNYDMEGLGEGYVRLISDQLHSSDSSIQVINKGFDGFTMPALKRFCKQQFTALKPDVLTILIGINDIGVIQNSGIDAAFALEEFKIGYKTLLEYIRQSYQGPIIIMEPFIFPYPERYFTWYENLTHMNQIIKHITEQYHLTFIPLWDTLLQEAKSNGYDVITTDGIHLTHEGHRLLANAWLDVYKNSRL